MSLFGFAMIVQPMFNKSTTAGGVAAVLFFIAGFFDQLVQTPEASYRAKMIASLSSPVAINRCIYILSNAEKGVGLNWNNIYTEYQNYVFYDGLRMMLFDGIMMTIIGIYLENVIQQQFGTAKNPVYFLFPSYWGCNCLSRKKVRSEIGEGTEGPEAEAEDYYMDSQFYEPVTNPELIAQEGDMNILKIMGLKRTFGDFKAVDGINLKMYSGQIFALLGHNGAGKSTTISMLTGLIPPTGGKCQVFDRDLFSQMDEVRKNMGVCPQHDVLFDLLTPEEHLDVFCDFKGVKVKDKKADIKQVLEDIDLWPQRN